MDTPTILLQPEDSKRVADAIIHQLRHPNPYSQQGFCEMLSDKIARAVERAVQVDLSRRKQ